MATAQLEAVDGEVRGALYTLDASKLVRVINHLLITEGTEEMSKFAKIKHILKYLDSDEVVKTQDGGLAVMEELRDYIKALTTTPDSTDMNTLEILSSIAKRDLKIQGQIGAPGQPDKLSYLSVARQIEDAITKGFGRQAIVNAVTRATVSGLPLRGYLESRPEITLPQLRSVLRSHFKEGDALDSYQMLSAASQGQKESAQDFVMRAMNIRQKVLFASQEEAAPLKYDPKLVRSTFLQTLKTGLPARLKGEMRQFLQDENITDEELLENLASIENLEEKRAIKRGPQAKVRAISEDTNQEPPVSKEIQKLMEGMKILQANVSALQEELRRPPSKQPNSHETEIRQPPREQPNGHGTDTSSGGSVRPPRQRGCHGCRQKGKGDDCDHCYKCGSAEHFARGCRKNNSGNGRRLPRGGRV